jgi:hypothetical protein
LNSPLLLSRLYLLLAAVLLEASALPVALLLTGAVLLEAPALLAATLEAPLLPAILLEAAALPAILLPALEAPLLLERPLVLCDRPALSHWTRLHRYRRRHASVVRVEPCLRIPGCLLP